MNYVLTGSIGHITKPIATQLIAAGHKVSIITSKAENSAAITTLGATPLVGSVADNTFLAAAFNGADVVYLMIPPNFAAQDWLAYQKEVADNFVTALEANAINKVLVLSSVGAHMINGAGPVDGLAYLEQELNKLPHINAYYLRPSYFYYNLFGMIPLIKGTDMMGSNIPATHKIVLTDTNDIADKAAALLLANEWNGKVVVYIASDVATFADVASTIGKAINKPNLQWVAFTDEQALGGMLQNGLPETFANGYIAMGKALNSGVMEADFWANEPKQYGKVKLADFVQQFAVAYNN